MPVESAADRAAFFDYFGVAATYSPEQFAGVHPSSKSRTVKGILDKEFVEIGNVETHAPIFDCTTADVSDASHGAKITIEGVVYVIRGVQPDGTGITRLILERC